MIRVDFYTPLTALELRDPMIKVCQEAAEQQDLHAYFDQGQQAALSGISRTPKSQRQRIGNGKHKVWSLNYYDGKFVYEYRKRPIKPNLVARLLVRSAVIPSEMKFGGFDYGEFGEEDPTYNHVKLYTPNELGHWSLTPLEPSEGLIKSTSDALKDHFESTHPRLFAIGGYDVNRLLPSH